MADQRNSDRDEPRTVTPDEEVRGVASGEDDEEFEDTDELEDDDAEDDERSSTF